MTDYTLVERSRLIEASPQQIMAEVLDFRAWQRWSAWEQLDPVLHREYSGAQSGPGARYAWSGNKKAGTGSMQIDAATDSTVDITVNFIKPFKSTNLSRFELSEQADATMVTWQMKSPKTLMTRIAGLFMNFDTMIGADMDKGLAGLAAVVE